MFLVFCHAEMRPAGLPAFGPDKRQCVSACLLLKGGCHRAVKGTLRCLPDAGSVQSPGYLARVDLQIQAAGYFPGFWMVSGAASRGLQREVLATPGPSSTLYMSTGSSAAFYV